MSDTPRTDREVYRITPENLKANVGFEVVNPALCRILERELAKWRDLAQKLTGVDANDHGWLRSQVDSLWSKSMDGGANDG